MNGIYCEVDMNEITKSIKLKEPFAVGKKIYIFCSACGSLVCINKFIFGSLHVCDDKAEGWCRKP